VETEPGVREVRQTVIHTTEPLMPESVVSEVDMATEEQQKNNSPQCMYRVIAE
jgi:hypothetical protein